MTDAYLRAAAALAIIDEYDDLPTNRQGGIRQRNHDAAIDRLADAMHTIYGPLPDIRIRGWNEDDRDDDRDDDIGDELADREETNDRNPSESRLSHEPVEFAGSDTTIADGQP